MITLPTWPKSCPWPPSIPPCGPFWEIKKCPLIWSIMRTPFMDSRQGFLGWRVWKSKEGLQTFLWGLLFLPLVFMAKVGKIDNPPWITISKGWVESRITSWQGWKSSCWIFFATSCCSTSPSTAWIFLTPPQAPSLLVYNFVAKTKFLVIVHGYAMDSKPSLLMVIPP